MVSLDLQNLQFATQQNKLIRTPSLEPHEFSDDDPLRADICFIDLHFFEST